MKLKPEDRLPLNVRSALAETDREGGSTLTAFIKDVIAASQAGLLGQVNRTKFRQLLGLEPAQTLTTPSRPLPPPRPPRWPGLID